MSKMLKYKKVAKIYANFMEGKKTVIKLLIQFNFVCKIYSIYAKGISDIMTL